MQRENELTGQADSRSSNEQLQQHTEQLVVHLSNAEEMFIQLGQQEQLHLGQSGLALQRELKFAVEILSSLKKARPKEEMMKTQLHHTFIEVSDVDVDMDLEVVAEEFERMRSPIRQSVFDFN